MFPDKCDPVDSKINYTTRVFCGGEFHIPLPNDGRDLEDPSKWGALFTCVNAETMELRWQVRVDGNMDLVATSYDGKLAASNQYNTENAADLSDMMSSERDACVFFNVERIEKLVKDGKFTTIGGSKVPVVDGRAAANGIRKPQSPATCQWVKPARRQRQPGRQVLRLLGQAVAHRDRDRSGAGAKWFAGEVKTRVTPSWRNRNRPGPIAHCLRRQGQCLHLAVPRQPVVKWNVDAAIAQFKGDKNAKVILETRRALPAGPQLFVHGRNQAGRRQVPELG
jgi:nitrous-oxide reductase